MTLGCTEIPKVQNDKNLFRQTQKLISLAEEIPGRQVVSVAD